MYIIITIFVIYAIGIISYEYGVFTYIFTAFFAMLTFYSYVTKRFIYNLVLIAFLVLAFINCHYNSSSVLSQYINEEVDIIAKIKTKNKTNPDSNFNSYNASILAINKLKLSEDENTIIYVDKNKQIKENSIVLLKGNVAESNFNKNKMMFNYNNYLRSKKIGAVVFSENTKLIKENYSFFNQVAIKFRNYVEKTFYAYLNEENANIVLSIILGNVDYLDNKLYDNIKLMGLAHIFAVSGSHIVIMYGFLLQVLKLCYLSHRMSWLITWVLIWFYGFLIGFPLSVMRTLVMFTLLFGAEIFYRKYSSLNAIGLAALVLTIYNPFWIFDAGFLLSFSAALSLIIYNKFIEKKLSTDNIILKSIYLYIFLQIFTLPVLAYYFNFLPIMGILYNLVLMPVFTVLLVYGFLLLIFNSLLSSFLIIPFKIFDYLLYSLRYIINFSEKFAFNGVIVPTMSISFIIFFYILLFFVIYLYNNKNLHIMKIGFATLISIYFLTFIIEPLKDDKLYINVADAGQGVFISARYKNTNFVFDCGSTSSKDFGKYTVVPYLTKRGVNDIDGVFISHWDSDHYSGLSELMDSHVKVRNIFASNNEIKIVDEVRVLNKDHYLKLDENLSIYILWPDKEYHSNNKNNTSLVILIKYKNMVIMLPGDIEKDVEAMILDDVRHADILLAPHHGSNTSSTESFVNAVRPDIVVLSYGRNNYGIPSKEVVERYENCNSLVLSTFEYGEINFILNGDKIYYNTYVNEKSDNYYELYFIDIIPKMINFFLLLFCIKNNKGEHYEL